MTKTVLLASAAVLALSVGGATAKTATHPALVGKGVAHQAIFRTPKGSKTLYDQTGNGDGNGIDSQNFESSFAIYDAQGADDFTVPKGSKWTVTEVDAPGLYYNGYGPSTSENVIFYKDAGGKPGSVVKNGEVDNIAGADNAGSYTLKLGKGVKLKKGHYWVSVVSNCSFGGGCGQWGWATNTVAHGSAAQWQNPGGGFGVCPTWDTLLNCTGVADPDFQFALKGKGK